MLTDNDWEKVCSVSELAQRLGLSRQRFYQLLKRGIFPWPVYCIHTHRPYYPGFLLQKCLEIRKTGIAQNGQAILFNSRRKKKAGKTAGHADLPYDEITQMLKRMGLPLTGKEVKKALMVLHPEGVAPNHDVGTLIRDLFRFFRPAG